MTDTTLAKKMGFSARWGSSCRMPFDAKEFIKAHPQWEHLEPYMPNRPSQPWTIFTGKVKNSKKATRNKKDKNKSTRKSK